MRKNKSVRVCDRRELQEMLDAAAVMNHLTQGRIMDAINYVHLGREIPPDLAPAIQRVSTAIMGDFPPALFALALATFLTKPGNEKFAEPVRNAGKIIAFSRAGLMEMPPGRYATIPMDISDELGQFIDYSLSVAHRLTENDFNVLLEAYNEHRLIPSLYLIHQANQAAASELDAHNHSRQINAVQQALLDLCHFSFPISTLEFN